MLLVAYLLLVVWVVLFKLSYDPVAVVRDYGTRSLNLVPFAGVSWRRASETISNVVAFVPLGVLLSMVAPRLAWWWRVLVWALLSVAFETTQYVLAIGTTDITDVISNTTGALVGVGLYEGAVRLGRRRAVDAVVLALGTVVLVAILLLRVFLLRVRYV